MAQLLRAYLKALRTRPILVNSATSGVVMLLGDQAAQQIEYQAGGRAQLSRENSIKRTLVLASFNACFGAPFFTVFWRVLEARIPGHSLTAAVAKAVATAVFASPSMNGTFFLYTTTAEHFLMPHRTPSSSPVQTPLQQKLRARFRQSYVNTITASAATWIPINAANFALVPPHLRVLVAQFAAVIWSTYLSLVAHGK